MPKKVKQREITSKHRRVLEMVNNGYKNAAICKELDIGEHTIYYVKKKYKDQINIKTDTDITHDLIDFDGNIDINLKRNLLKIGNAISQVNLQKCSPTQLTTMFGILYDKHRLQAGRSTQNISKQVIESMDSEQLEIIKESIRSLKKSMLIEDKTPKG